MKPRRKELETMQDFVGIYAASVLACERVKEAHITTESVKDRVLYIVFASKEAFYEAKEQEELGKLTRLRNFIVWTSDYDDFRGPEQLSSAVTDARGRQGATVVLIGCNFIYTQWLMAGTYFL